MLDHLIRPPAEPEIVDSSTPTRRTPVAAYAGVAVLAFLVRLVPVLIGGGLGFYGRYDDGVYYAAADALTYGRIPYRDFVLLHPPGIALILAPFALLGRLTSDPVGMAAARLGFMAVGALNTVMVTKLAGRWGRRPAIAAGLLYACCYPAVYSEQTTLLEPIGGALILIALLLLLKTERVPTVRAELLAGVALGLAECVKIWYVAPWLAIVAWQLLVRRQGAAMRVLAGGAAAMVVVLGPFYVLAGSRMFDMVVRDQLLRPQTAVARLARLPSIVGLRPLLPVHGAALTLITVVVLVLLALAAWSLRRDRAGRVLVAVLVVNLTVLMTAPPFFAHYAAFTAAPAALVVGIALGERLHMQVPRMAVAAYPVALAIFVASGIGVAAHAQGKRFPSATFEAAAPPGCITSDEPSSLIAMNRLSSDLRDGCPVPVDVTGIAYDTLHRTLPDGQQARRVENAAWQSYVTHYLTSGSAFVVAGFGRDGLDRTTIRTLVRHPAIAYGDGLVLRSNH